MSAVAPTNYALLIGNGSAPSATLLAKYAQNAHKIVVLDSAIVTLSTTFPKLNIDVLLGDFDRDFQTEYYKIQYPQLEIIRTPDQEKADFEKGIDYLVTLGYEHIIGLGLTGKRMDHTLSNMSILAKFHPQVHIELADDYSHITCISNHFEKHFPKDTIISLIPIGKVEGVTTQNLAYPIEGSSLSFGAQISISNKVAKTGMVSINLQKGKLLVMECRDA